MKRIIAIIAYTAISAVALFAQQSTTPKTALDDYLNNGDPTNGWEVRDEHRIQQTNVYSILLISQKWQGILWKHELTLYVPDECNTNAALLFIGGGSINEGIPRYISREDGFSQQMAWFAQENKSVVAMLRQVPFQRLFGGLSEDALISYTLDKFRTSNDYSWPLLFPMTKSAIAAMDATQQFAKQNSNRQIDRFVVSGLSKRGWTTWMTAASGDERVVAIAPMVIDMLNLPTTLKYQIDAYGEYSEQIHDYVRMGIPQAMESEFGQSIVDMIDPYSYRQRLVQPKMLFMGTNDPYWTVDAVKHYIYQIPGQNMIHYVPNAGHDLGDKQQALHALSAFFALTVNDNSYPVCSSAVKSSRRNITLEAEGNFDQLTAATLWMADSQTRDFRKSEWKSSEVKLNSKDKNRVKATVQHPKTGFRAFYIAFTHRLPNGREFITCTRMYMADPKQVFTN